MNFRTALWATFLLAALTSCKQETSGPAPSSKPALPAPVASGLPGDPSRVSGVVNPNKEKAYDGPTATVRGRVRSSGDAASAAPVQGLEFTAECGKARDIYGYPFQEGPARELADVLVTVTGYQGYVAETKPAVTLEGKDCSWGARTIALTYGQRIDVVSKDKNSYVPDLLGSKMKAQLVATPFGKGTANLYPPAAGRYILIDNLPHIFDPFRSGSPRRTGAQGLGLGLYIVQQVVQAHDGYIDVVTRNGSTLFRVNLPRTVGNER